MRTVANSRTQDAVARALSDVGDWSGGDYAGAMALALDRVRPNFERSAYRDSFRTNAVDRDWFASLLASNLYMEGYSAGRLKQYAGVLGDGALGRDLGRHARDEARHSRQFFELIFLTFPHLGSEAFRAEADANVIDLDAVTPCPDDYPAPPEDEILNSLILMNLFEVKSMFLVDFVRPFAIAHAPDGNGEAVGTIMAGIAHDECQHIAYTARHIDRLVRRVGVETVADRMAGFIELMNGSDDFHF